MRTYIASYLLSHTDIYNYYNYIIFMLIGQTSKKSRGEDDTNGTAAGVSTCDNVKNKAESNSK